MAPFIKNLLFLLLSLLSFARTFALSPRADANYQECIVPERFGVNDNVIINDEQLTSSSARPEFPAYNGRLGLHSKAWCASTNNKSQWLQVDLRERKVLLAITTEGTVDAWVTQYYLQYSNDMETWYCYGDEITNAKMLQAYQSSFTMTLLQRPIARYVRLNPQAWNGNICLRFELYGCHISQSQSSKLYKLAK
ncbi:retinoschisin-like [Nematostella vectensis]|uniref:retinoschisin-like n=1 Tax=Nematostella vectensis TaxID=45351 RepID=UPI002077192C|nr:retinoschisin-like [Nematostella vectensis]